MKLREFTKMHGLGNDFLIFPWDENLPKKNDKSTSFKTRGHWL